MSARFPVLALTGATLVLAGLVAGCGSSGVGPSDSSGPLATESAPTTTPSPSTMEQSLEPSASPSTKPVASGVIDPAAFTSTIDNPWFPLVPGTKFTYQGTKDGKKAVETFVVTTDTKVIAGVTCVVVEDKVSLGGVASERLLGYYAQDRDGNVWYFGEDMLEVNASGQVVSTEGSWHAGVNKAPPALFMEASPTVGKTFVHDYTKNDFAVISLAAAVKVPYGSFADALVTKEWSPLEPDVEARKYYVRDVGLVRDVAVKGPREELVLVKVEHA